LNDDAAGFKAGGVVVFGVAGGARREQRLNEPGGITIPKVERRRRTPRG